jgi:uncharacterized membrane protein
LLTKKGIELVFIEQGIIELKKINSDRENLQEQSVTSVDFTKSQSDCATASQTERDKKPSDLQFEIFLSNLLKYGVLLTSTVVLIGGILYLIDCGAEPANYHFFQGEPSTLCSPIGILTAVLSGNCRGIIQLGLLLLIATPIIRVIFSLLIFLWRRDFIYVIITSLVLGGLIYSTIGAYFS